MTYLSLRWVFLLAALAGAARCAWSGPTAARAGFVVVCGLLWFFLSQRKAHSLDRGVLGVPPRS